MRPHGDSRPTWRVPRLPLRAVNVLSARILLPLVSLGLVLGLAAFASGALYVTDQLGITLRSGPGLDYKIVKMVPSGTALDKLEDKEGWARVRTPAGDEGWVVARYLTTEPPKGPQLEDALRQLQSLRTTAASQKTDLDSLRADRDRLAAQVGQLQARLDAVQKEYTGWKKVNEGVVALKEKADASAADQAAARTELDRLRTENRNLRVRQEFYWFFSGVAVLLLGWLLGYLFASSRQKGKSRSRLRI